MSAMSPSLTTLPVEILGHICDAISRSYFARGPRSMTTVSRTEEHRDRVLSLYSYSEHPLVPFSQASSWLRAVCCPRMFAVLTLQERYSRRYHDMDKLPPRTILRYIITLRITHPTLPGSDEDLTATMRGMVNLSEVFWRCLNQTFSLTARHFQIFFEARSLDTLRLGDIFRVDAVAQLAHHGVVAPSLRVLDLSQTARDLSKVTVEELNDENMLIESLLKDLSGQLQVLHIPSESCRLSFLSAIPWPELRELAFVGGVPHTDASFAQVLSAAPKLRVVTLLRFWHNSWTIWPSELPAASLPLDIQRLTISDINPEDRVVHHLSASLTELSLRDMPRYYRRRHRRLLNAVALLTAREAYQIMCTVRGQILKRLEIVFREDEHELELITLISRSCPNLSFLELHRYAADDHTFRWLSPEKTSVPMEYVANALTSLRHLRTLRLNFDLGVFVTDYAFKDYFPDMTAARWRPYLAAHARCIATSLPWLCTVAFLAVEASGLVSWNTWYVAGMPESLSEWEVDEYLGDS